MEKHTNGGLRGISLLALSLGLGACGSPRHLGIVPEAVVGPPVSAPEEPYRIQPGDELEIRYFHTPDQNVTVPVRPDGRISLPLIPELRAAGRTVEDLRREVVDLSSQELASPEIAVIVRSFASYLVHVGGEVQKPGVLKLNGPHTVLEAVLEAGGMLPSADLQDVLVVRRLEPRGYELLGANLQALLAGEDSGGNLALHPYDVVYVPSSPIGEVNRWVDQYIRKNLPINFSLTYRIDDPSP